MLKRFCPSANATRLMVVLSVGLLFASTAWAQGTGRISGTVREKGNGDLLIGANLIFKGTAIGSVTDLRGRYTINGVPAGRRVLVVSYIGYRTLELDVNVVAGDLLQLNVEMEWIGVVGEDVVITAQARGQLNAINQQLSSNTISNIVSSDRIQEIPDVNAAESIGRLPGVSIQRSGGEANRIAIRGLSPKYNTVTVNGVRVPSTSSNDRSVDLSLISSNMLDGIEVTKALTPDKDADALGGSVDLRLRTAPDKFLIDLQAQGGYTALQQSYDNYKLVGTVSNRFLRGGRIGAILTVNADRYNRSADQFSGSYTLIANPQNNNEREPTVNSLNLQENSVNRERLGTSLTTDIRIPGGRVTLNGFYNEIINDWTQRRNELNVNSIQHRYAFSDNWTKAWMSTVGIGVEQQLRWFSYDLGYSTVNSRNRAPENLSWDFMEESAGPPTVAMQFVPPDSVPSKFFNNLDNTFFNNMAINSSVAREEESTWQANLKIPFRMGRHITGYVKGGGKMLEKNRSYDQESIGVGLYYGGSMPLRNIIAQELPELGLATQMQRFGLSYFQDDYTRSNFLAGRYPLGYTLNANSLRKVTEVSRPYMLYFGQNSLGNDYEGYERITAGYAMMSLNVSRFITIMPGFRYEEEHTRYRAKFVRGMEDRLVGFDVAYTDTSTTRRNSFLLPMIHLQIKPVKQVNLRLAYTETLTRPDYRQFAPITYISRFGDWVTAPNTRLKTANARNYDASLSINQNHVGLFTVSGFYKEMDNMIWGVSFPRLPGQTILPDLVLPGVTGAPTINTSLNNTYLATMKGVEFDWQTSFWYLPSLLKGLVLNVNHTVLESETKYPQIFSKQVPIVPRPRTPPFNRTVMVDTFRVGRMFDQPSSITNVTVGYDFKGFSARLSYLFQADVLTGLASTPAGDRFTADYRRWDLALKQQLPRNVQVYANFNNINNREDRNFQSSIGAYPTFIEYYGFTMDVGVRFTF
jgi:TonB-dependent receptor